MLDLTGKCCGGIEAIEFMESLADIIDEDVKTEEFCEEYEAALNRFRYEVKKNIGEKKKIIKAKNKRYHDFEYCGRCGFAVGEVAWKYCPNCGTRCI